MLFWNRNHFNFVSLSNLFELNDENTFFNSKSVNALEENYDDENGKTVKRGKKKRINGIVDTINIYIFETTFPFLTTFAILIVLALKEDQYF